MDSHAVETRQREAQQRYSQSAAQRLCPNLHMLLRRGCWRSSAWPQSLRMYLMITAMKGRRGTYKLGKSMEMCVCACTWEMSAWEISLSCYVNVSLMCWALNASWMYNVAVLLRGLSCVLFCMFIYMFSILNCKVTIRSFLICSNAHRVRLREHLSSSETAVSIS